MLAPTPAASPDRLRGHPVDFHDLRHYYASQRIRHGASVKAVQARLGHKEASDTLDTYWYHHGLRQNDHGATANVISPLEASD